MRNAFDYYDDDLYLAHHGIKGMKWGIRRYQNEDGSYTEAGKKRYFNPDGSLNYRGIQKKRRDEIDKNPYGHRTESGRYARTAEQANRQVRDRIKYGSKAVERIEDKVRSGQGYYKARKPEQARAIARAAIASASSLAYFDLLYNDGKGISNASRKLVYSGKKVANNMIGIYGKIPAVKVKFDDEMLKNVFG